MADDLRPLRLCLVSAEYSTVTRGGVGGIGAHFYTLAHALAEAGHQVVVLTEGVGGPQQSTEGGVEVHAIARGSRRQWKLGRWLPVPWLKWSFAVRRRLRRMHAERAFDLVVFPDGYGEGFRFSLSPHIPFVVMLLGPASVVQRWDGRRVPLVRARVESWVERTPAARAPLLLCASSAFADQIADEWSLVRSRIRIVRNPLDLDRFRPRSPEDAVPANRVLFVGHLQRLKGVHDLVAAIPAVVARCPDAEFLLVGNDTRTGPGRSSLRALLEQELSALGVVDRVRFVAPVPQAELVPLYHSCALLVLPSHHDVYPNAVLEAMGCGRPCVVTGTTGVAELVSESGCGIVVAPHDPAALAAAIGEILAMAPGSRAEMGMKGRRSVEKLCATPTIAGQAVAAFREAIERFHVDRCGRAVPG